MLKLSTFLYLANPLSAVSIVMTSLSWTPWHCLNLRITIFMGLTFIKSEAISLYNNCLNLFTQSISHLLSSGRVFWEALEGDTYKWLHNLRDAFVTARIISNLKLEAHLHILRKTFCAWVNKDKIQVISFHLKAPPLPEPQCQKAHSSRASQYF